MRSRTDFAVAVGFSSSGGTSGGGNRRRRAEQVLEDPLAAHHRRRAVRVGGDEQQAAVAEQTAARIVGHRHAAEVGTVDVRDPVVPGQPLVHERVVRIEEIEHRSILAHDALEEHLGLALEGLTQVVVEVGERS